MPLVVAYYQMLMPWPEYYLLLNSQMFSNVSHDFSLISLLNSQMSLMISHYPHCPSIFLLFSQMSLMISLLFSHVILPGFSLSSMISLWFPLISRFPPVDPDDDRDYFCFSLFFSMSSMLSHYPPIVFLLNPMFHPLWSWFFFIVLSRFPPFFSCLLCFLPVDPDDDRD